ncbi:MAG: alpha/beta hydrolase [Planctomycetes bacterium]|nr:alpha/beta hydrolase [Planctomycetota bacterium]
MTGFVPPPAVARALLQLPRPLRAAVLGRRVVVDGQTLDRQTQLLLWADRRLGLPGLGAGTVHDARARFQRTSTLLVAPPPPHTRAELTVAGRPARAYAPIGAGRLPGLVYLHGGGWVLGDLESHDAVCADLAVRVGCRVVAVDYRLAPEHPFPAAVEDAHAAFLEVVARADALGLDPARVGVGGDSAGANLSAVVALLCRDAGGPAPRAQVLVYPSVDQTSDAPSHTRFARGFLLTEDDIRWFRGHYLRGADDARDPRASPLLAPDLRGVAPALVVSAGFDPLRDEASAYAARLRAAGVRVVERCERDLLHGFLSMAGPIRAARRAALALAADMRAAL